MNKRKCGLCQHPLLIHYINYVVTDGENHLTFKKKGDIILKNIVKTVDAEIKMVMLSQRV